MPIAARTRVTVQDATVLRRFGAAVRKHRQRLRLTEEQFAERAGLSRDYVVDLENGTVNITLSKLDQVAVAAGVSISDILATMENAWPGVGRRRRRLYSLCGHPVWPQAPASRARRPCHIRKIQALNHGP